MPLRSPAGPEGVGAADPVNELRRWSACLPTAAQEVVGAYAILAEQIGRDAVAQLPDGLILLDLTRLATEVTNDAGRW